MGSSSQQTGELVIEGHHIQLTNITKILWKKKDIRKIDFLNYLIKVSEFMLPFLKDRVLTTIRFPNGVHSESFYQKNCPDYAPDYISRYNLDEIDYILCQDLASLLWLGNQAAIEYHVPFSLKDQQFPSEIVFDLDPPSRNEFSMAVQAALIIKECLDQLNLYSFVKTSGNKGLQVYLPIKDNTFSYTETRIFTAFIANYLVEKEPKWFTTERFKDKRGKKLYVDYVQHAKRKTIIAPYSLRANEEALVAMPLFWDEVNETLKPTDFPMEAIGERLEKKNCPFESFVAKKGEQPLEKVLEALVQNGN